MSRWWFSIAGDPWKAEVQAAPIEDTRSAFWEIAVPALAGHDGPLPPRPCVVVCRVTAPAASRSAPAGPLGRAKGLLDALHDDRKSGPWYRDRPGRAPLIDDHPEHVSGLAVEVRRGEPQTEYELGTQLRVGGEMLASVSVGVAAPNDIAGTRREHEKIAEARAKYARAVQRAFRAEPSGRERPPFALVVRHRPQRDEDNTWATWIAAACGVRGQRLDHWSRGAPLSGWMPSSIASVADPALASPVVYELWG